MSVGIFEGRHCSGILTFLLLFCRNMGRSPFRKSGQMGLPFKNEVTQDLRSDRRVVDVHISSKIQVPTPKPRAKNPGPFFL